MKKINWFFNIAVVLSGLSLLACGGGGGGAAGGVSGPTVSSTTPAEGSTGVLTNTKLSITFNQDMDAATINNSSFSLSGASTVSGSVTYNAATRTATFTPDTSLNPGTDYTATLTTTVTDTAGNALVSVYVGRFSTETFIRRVSVDSSEAQADNSSVTPKVSADGRYVVFASFAANLVSGDTNSQSDIFIRDTQNGITTRVNVGAGGAQAINGSSNSPAITADGRYVVYASSATNLVSGDSNNQSDIFIYDTQGGSTRRASVSDSSGLQATNQSSVPSVSDDGRYVAFISSAANLVSGDTNNQTDIFVRDLQQGKTFRVNIDNNEVQATASADLPHISGNGRYVVFASTATNLVVNDTNGQKDVFVRDIQNGSTARVSVSNSGTQSTGFSSTSDISADGRYVAFASSATDLIGAGNDTNGVTDIFVRDTQNNTTTRGSVANGASGGQATGTSFDPVISDNGRYVGFQSEATNLLSSADSNGRRADVFVRDTQASTTIRVNVNNSGAVGSSVGFGGTTNIGISADGRYVVFNINASNLAVGGDNNGADDVFRALNTTP